MCCNLFTISLKEILYRLTIFIETNSDMDFSQERKQVLNILLFVVAAVFFMHTLASIFSWYWVFVWYDDLVHLLGGFFIGLSILWFIFLSGYISRMVTMPPAKLFLVIVVSVVILGAAWEIYEWIFKATYAKEGYALDTFFDLAMDFLGGSLSVWYFIKKKFYLLS